MLWSSQRRFCYVHIPKTGGETVTASYEPHMLFDDVLLGGTVYGEALQPKFRARFGLHKHSMAREVIRVAGAERFEEMFSFTTIREPMSRMVSLYKYFRNGYNPQRGYTHALQPAAVEKGFTEFVAVAAPGIETQTNFVRAEGRVVLDLLVRLPDLDAQWPAICRRIGLDMPLHVKNRSGSEAVDISDEARQIVAERYAPDFDLYDSA